MGDSAPAWYKLARTIPSETMLMSSGIRELVAVMRAELRRNPRLGVCEVGSPESLSNLEIFCTISEDTAGPWDSMAGTWGT
jgi:hypothetical protein